LNAATGEVYIEDTKETVLGSAGHALELKVESTHTDNLKVVLVEEDPLCYDHLKKVIERRWPTVSVEEAEGPVHQNSSNIYLLNRTLDEALAILAKLDLGNAIYFFDPLRSVKWDTVEKTARDRIRDFYQTGTEFLIFLFTSDWFLGRDDLAPLPIATTEENWIEDEKQTVLEADEFFGGKEWRSHILNENPVDDRQRVMVELYRNKLHKWFRYVLPLPFNPKEEQLFHLFLCSNYETGVRMTRNAYTLRTGNPKYSPSNLDAFRLFKQLHPEVFENMKGKRRPMEWRILWRIIRQHEGGRCDCMCSDFAEIMRNPVKIQNILEWLTDKRYLQEVDREIAWKVGELIKLYELDWEIVRSNLRVEAPAPMIPLSSEQASRVLLPIPEQLQE